MPPWCTVSWGNSESENVAFERLNIGKYGLRQNISLEEIMLHPPSDVSVSRAHGYIILIMHVNFTVVVSKSVGGRIFISRIFSADILVITGLS